MGSSERQRVFLVATCGLLASFVQNLFGLAGLVLAILLAVLGYSAARRTGVWQGLLARPATLRMLALILSALTVILGAIYGLRNFDEPIAPLIEEIWVLGYLLAATETLLPELWSGTSAALRGGTVYKLFILLTLFVSFLLGALDLAYVAWAFGAVYCVLLALPEGLLAPFDPRRLWASSGERLATMGLALAGACLGLTWAQQSYYNPGYYSWDLGYVVDTWFSSYGVSLHIYGFDLLPALLLTGLFVWLAGPRSAAEGAQRLLPPIALAAILLYGLYFSLMGQFGPKAFIIALVVAAAGFYMILRTRGPGAGAHHLGG